MSLPKSPHPLLEACVETEAEALHAQAQGAHRIELCSRLDLDGLSPEPELLERLCKTLGIPVMAMVRPRPGDFVYSPTELEEMHQTIQRWKELGAAGVVFGVLHPDGTVNLEATARLAEAAAPLAVTFHKAFDATPDPMEALRQLQTLPRVTSILTSGGAPSAWEGRHQLKELLRTAGERPTLLVAGKVTPEILPELHAFLGARAYHGRRIVG